LLASHKLENSYFTVKLLHTLHQWFDTENCVVYRDLNYSTAFLLGEIQVSTQHELHPEKREWGSGSTQNWGELISKPHYEVICCKLSIILLKAPHQAIWAPAQ